MSIKVFNDNVLHVEHPQGEFPDKLEYGGDMYGYGTYYNIKQTIAIYYKESWMDD